MHLRRAVEYTLLWPDAATAVRAFCAAPLALALATLREMGRGEHALRAGQAPKVSRAEALHIFGEARRTASDDEALLGLFREVGGPATAS
jgi:hypothetical protein